MNEEGIREKMLVVLVESVLGKGRSTARNNMAFSCPFCHHSKTKLEIQVHTNEKKENPWHCWVCGEKGKTLSSLFKKIKVPSHKIAELNSLIKPGKKQENQIHNLSLPKEFIPHPAWIKLHKSKHDMPLSFLNNVVSLKTTL